jgi:iron complex transport system substrate-binding protein
MKNFNLAFTISFILLLAACGKPKSNRESKTIGYKATCNITYAKGFKIERYADYSKVTVRNPWDTAHIMETYILVDRNKEMPKNLPQGSIVKVPVQRVATCSSIFAGEYKQLGNIDKIVAVTEPEYVDITEIKAGLKTGKVSDLGLQFSLNAEKLIASKVEILVVSPYEESIHDRFKKLGLTVVKDASYMEDSPLGRTEWIKFEAAFQCKDSLANAIFSKIEKRYLDICQKVQKTSSRPTVFTEKKFGDTWYTAGGNSYMGRFMKDAGANYLWSDLKNSGSIPLTFEKVYSKAINAQFWLFKYNNTQSNMTLKQLGAEYDLYKNFAAYKTGNVFAVNSGITPFYEKGPLEPDIVLTDLVSIFHPEIFPDYKPKYYFKLK